MCSSLHAKALVINLLRDVGRRESVKKELSSKIIEFSFFEAVDGRKLSQVELEENATPLARWFLTPGMIGCFLSHRRCWEQCVLSGKPVIIFEDDVVLADNFQEKVTNAMEQCKDGKPADQCDILLLGAFGCVNPLKPWNYMIASYLMGGRRTPCHIADIDNTNKSMTEKSSSFIHVPPRPLGMHAYIVMPKGAEKLLKSCPRASYHVDVVAWGRQDLNVYAVHPLVATQLNGDSTVSTSWNLWKQILSANWFCDTYTGIHFGQYLSNVVLRPGGPLFGGRISFTLGDLVAIFLSGLTIAYVMGSETLLYASFAFVAVNNVIVRIMI